jgi:hypothetical protein
MNRGTRLGILLAFSVFDVFVAAALFSTMVSTTGHFLESTADGVLCAAFLLMAVITSARIRWSNESQ